LVREGGNHAIWKNPANGKSAPIPRHREIKEGTVRAVCRQLTGEGDGATENSSGAVGD
ncbi:MAG TPA: type II toxin-antitoxin system HicA family toxin, partial [Verrucomicrobiae bacterium]|nr:type II toxin-antitoxin system HicA family toxin [Verrucomicrobiae bacterium]